MRFTRRAYLSQDGSPFISPDGSDPSVVSCTSVDDAGCASYAKPGAFPRAGLPYGIANNMFSFAYIFGQVRICTRCRAASRARAAHR